MQTAFNIFFTFHMVIIAFEKGSTLQPSVKNLGILLLTILMFMLSGSSVLFFANETNSVIVFGLGTVFLLLLLTLAAYLLFDLYNAYKERSQ